MIWDRMSLGVVFAAAAMLAGRHALASELTASIAGERAVQASFERASAADVSRAAEARVEQARAALLPRVGATARYTRLSDITPPALFPFSIAATNAPAGTVAPPTTSTGPIAIAPVLDNYTLDATLTLPLSDYVLRLARNVTAARRGRDSARWEEVTVAAQARLEGRSAFYEWLRARAAADAAGQVATEQRAHLSDVAAQLAEGNASRADALRVESAVADAEAAVAEAEARRVTAETRLRIRLHLGDEMLSTTEALEAALEATGGDTSALVREAQRSRAELRGLDAAEQASRVQASIARATYLPTLAAFANATYANPNPRYFPPTEAWRGTWAAGVALSWAPTEIPGARASAAEHEARGDALAAQQGALRDLVTLQVVEGLQAVRAADAKVAATEKQIEAATEARRITRSLVLNTRATTSNLLDAETDLVRARFAWINARVEARLSRARLEHALGRDQAAP